MERARIEAWIRVSEWGASSKKSSEKVVESAGGVEDVYWATAGGVGSTVTVNPNDRGGTVLEAVSWSDDPVWRMVKKLVRSKN